MRKIVKHEYDDRGNMTYYETNNGYWVKYEYDDRGNETYYEDSNGYWAKWEYDDHGNESYCEDSDGEKRGTPRADIEQELEIERE